VTMASTYMEHFWPSSCRRKSRKCSAYP